MLFAGEDTPLLPNVLDKHGCTEKNAFPYRSQTRQPCFILENASRSIATKLASGSEGKYQCHQCHASIEIDRMRSHVGQHILCRLLGVPENSLHEQVRVVYYLSDYFLSYGSHIRYNIASHAGFVVVTHAQSTSRNPAMPSKSSRLVPTHLSSNSEMPRSHLSDSRAPMFQYIAQYVISTQKLSVDLYSGNSISSIIYKQCIRHTGATHPNALRTFHLPLLMSSRSLTSSFRRLYHFAPDHTQFQPRPLSFHNVNPFTTIILMLASALEFHKFVLSYLILGIILLAV